MADESSELELLVDIVDSDSSESVEEEQPQRQTRQRVQYELANSFETVEDFALWRDNGGLEGWQEKSKTKLRSGAESIFYGCLTQNCSQRMKLLFSANDESVRVEVGSGGHNQEAHNAGTVLTHDMKHRIKELSKTLKPQAIRLKLLEDTEANKVPTLTQVQNYVARLRSKVTPSKPLTDADLINYANSHLNLPDDEDQAFVVGFAPYEDEHFLLVWSTQKLIKVQREAKLLCTDATYKLNWYGFPVFVAGTVDIKSSFHPTFLALSSHEDEISFSKFFEIIAEKTGQNPTHVLADGAQSITNAAVEIFPNSIRLMCWAHAVKNIDKRLKSLDAETKAQIRHEIQTLQFALNEDQFENVAECLLTKWADDYDEDFSFLDYFQRTWVNSDHFRWFEGASTFPSTNNALEAHNKQIKDLHSLRERLPFNKFVLWAEKMVSINWSKSRDVPNEIELAIKPYLFAEARKLHNAARQIFVLRRNEQWAIPGAEHSTLTSRQVKDTVRLLNSSNFVSFDQFVETRFKVYVVSKTEGIYSCSCRVGAKKHYCKHIVFIGCKVGDFNYPPDAVAQTLSQKRKRGRPKKADTQTQSRN